MDWDQNRKYLFPLLNHTIVAVDVMPVPGRSILGAFEHACLF